MCGCDQSSLNQACPKHGSPIHTQCEPCLPDHASSDAEGFQDNESFVLLIVISGGSVAPFNYTTIKSIALKCRAASAMEWVSSVWV